MCKSQCKISARQSKSPRVSARQCKKVQVSAKWDAIARAAAAILSIVSLPNYPSTTAAGARSRISSGAARFRTFLTLCLLDTQNMQCLGMFGYNVKKEIFQPFSQFTNQLQQLKFVKITSRCSLGSTFQNYSVRQLDSAFRGKQDQYFLTGTNGRQHMERTEQQEAQSNWMTWCYLVDLYRRLLPSWGGRSRLSIVHNHHSGTSCSVPSAKSLFEKFHTLLGQRQHQLEMFSKLHWVAWDEDLHALIVDRAPSDRPTDRQLPRSRPVALLTDGDDGDDGDDEHWLCC